MPAQIMGHPLDSHWCTNPIHHQIFTALERFMAGLRWILVQTWAPVQGTAMIDGVGERLQ